MGKNLDPKLKPGKQHAISKQENMERPCIGQGRSGLRRIRSDSINQIINQPSDLSQKIPGRMKIETGKTNPVHTKDLMHSINNTSGRMTNNNHLIPDVPFHPGPVYKPPPKPIRHDTSIQEDSRSSSSIEDINPNINLDFEENSPFQEGAVSKTFQRLDKSFFQERKELGEPHKQGKCNPKFFAKAGRYR